MPQRHTMRADSQTGTDNAPLEPAPSPETARPSVLVVEPQAERRAQVCRGLVALGYRPEAFATIDEVPWSSSGPWAMVLTGLSLCQADLAELDRRLEALGDRRPAVRSLASVYSEEGAETSDAADSPSHRPTPDAQPQRSSEEFKVELLQWVVEQGPAVLRPVPCPDAVLGYAYPTLENHYRMAPGGAVHVLEDLADFGALARRLANRVHACPSCRHWTLNFRETCPTCSSLEIEVEGLIHHFACAYVGLDSEYRRGSELYCPKCQARLQHIGVEYERPGQTYVCHDCERMFEEAVVTAQCLHCRWEGPGTEVLVWSIYEYELTERGREAVERGELRGLKLREMIRTRQYELASREFFELEVEREMFRLQRYGRPVSILLCRFLVNDVPYAVFRETQPQTLRALAKLVCRQVRTLDVAALADAATIVILLPETNASQAKKALTRLSESLDSFEIPVANGQTLERRWTARSWDDRSAGAEDALEWFRQQLE